MRNRVLYGVLSVVLAAGLLTGCAGGKREFPNKEITVVVPWNPGRNQRSDGPVRCSPFFEGEIQCRAGREKLSRRRAARWESRILTASRTATPWSCLQLLPARWLPRVRRRRIWTGGGEYLPCGRGPVVLVARAVENTLTPRGLIDAARSKPEGNLQSAFPGSIT